MRTERVNRSLQNPLDALRSYAWVVVSLAALSGIASWAWSNSQGPEQMATVAFSTPEPWKVHSAAVDQLSLATQDHALRAAIEPGVELAGSARGGLWIVKVTGPDSESVSRATRSVESQLLDGVHPDLTVQHTTTSAPSKTGRSPLDNGFRWAFVGFLCSAAALIAANPPTPARRRGQ